jgi:hypothetical protein
LFLESLKVAISHLHDDIPANMSFIDM